MFHDTEGQYTETLARFLERTWKSQTPPRIPVEVIEVIIQSSSVSCLKAWTLTCKTLLPIARCRLFKKAAVRINSKDDAQSFIQLISQPSPLPTAATYVRWVTVGGTPTKSVGVEVWQAEAIRMLYVSQLVNVTCLTVDMRYTAVGGNVFKWLLEESRVQHMLLLPNVCHVKLIGAATIPAYHVMEAVSLFPRLETLKFQGFRWNTFSRFYYIPFPPLLHTIEADIDPVLNAGVVLLIMFDESEERPRRCVPHFTLRITHDYAKMTERFAQSEPAPQGRSSMNQVLRALNKIVPTVESMKLEVPMLDIGTEDDIKAYLSQNGFLRKLETLNVNGIALF